jgi:16S rRNA (cytosine967-C5)-methyltransferase
MDATEAWLRFNNQPAPVTLRVNRLRHTPEEMLARLAGEEVEVRPARFAPEAFIVERGHPLRGAGRDAGWFVVQDEASQLVTLLAGAMPGVRVLDTCASPGGKTTAIAAAMEDRGLLVACDVRDRRMALLRSTVKASGASHVRLVQADLLKPLPFRPTFDSVFVDAPCSGLGTLRRDPDIRWRRSETDLPVFAAAELTMLQHAAEMVAPGGRLVYATCSSEPDENVGVADAFLATTPGFVALSARDAHPEMPSAVVDARGHLCTEPHVHGLEAFFGAVFVRNGETVPVT